MLRNTLDGRGRILDIIEALEHDALARVLKAAHGRRLLYLDLKAVQLQIDADDFDLSRCGDLLKAIFDVKSDDPAYAYQVWGSAIKHVWSTLQLEEETLSDTPPPGEARLACTGVQETPYSANSASIEHASGIQVPEIRLVLQDELEGKLVLDHPDFERVYFGGISGLGDMVERASIACQDGDEPLYTTQHRWRGLDAYDQATVMAWFRHMFKSIQSLVAAHSSPPHRYRVIHLPDTPVRGSLSEQKLDIAIAIDGPEPSSSSASSSSADAASGTSTTWPQVLLYGEQKKRKRKLEPLLQVAGYTQEIFGAQPGRRFVLGFSLREAMMRLFMFDRSGGVASYEFDVHQNSRRAMQAFVAFQTMGDQQLGLDPTIRAGDDGHKRIQIVRDGGVAEVVVLDEVLATTKAIASRGTTVWKGHLLGDAQRNPVVVKDTWQLAERPDEGESY
jgi:hypothetical protein